MPRLPFQRSMAAEGGGEGGFGVDVDAAVEDHGFEAREAVEAVGVDAVAGGLGEEAGAEGGAVFAEAEVEHGSAECFVEVVVGDSEHDGLDPASVDDVALAGDGGAVVGGEEEEEAGDLFGKDVALERLCSEDALLVGGRHVEAVLAFGEDGSGEDAVDADVGGAEFA